MHTGAEDISHFGELKNWNYAPKTEYYPDECGQVTGSAGEFYPPRQSKDKPISFFNPDMCRSVELDFEDEVDVKGINGYKYSGGKKSVDNGNKYPETKCFSVGETVPSGVMNVSACRYGTPVFMSFPHYYGADPFYLNQVEGLHPSKEKHQFYFTLEPQLGVPIDVAARLQVNMLIRPTPNIALYEEAPQLFFPVLWFEQKVQINDEMASDIKIASSIPTIGYICAGILSVIGVLILLWIPFDQFVRQKDEKHNKETNMGMEIGKRPEDSPLMGNKNGLVDCAQITRKAEDSSATIR